MRTSCGQPGIAQSTGTGRGPRQAGGWPACQRLIDELVRAARADHHLSIIILAAALVDILTHEGTDGFADTYDNVDSEEEEGIGLSMLRAGERRALDQLRAMRNRILHYQGAPLRGLAGIPRTSCT